jgi:hypothetical protein
LHCRCLHHCCGRCAPPQINPPAGTAELPHLIVARFSCCRICRVLWRLGRLPLRIASDHRSFMGFLHGKTPFAHGAFFTFPACPGCWHPTSSRQTPGPAG